MKANVKNDRIVPVVIAGNEAHFNYSLYAAKEILKRYNGMENLGTAMEGKGVDQPLNKKEEESVEALDVTADESVEALDVMADVFALLLNEGAEYLTLQAKLSGTNAEKLFFTATPRELQSLLSMEDMNDLTTLFFHAVKIGSGRTVEVKPDAKKPKTAPKA